MSSVMVNSGISLKQIKHEKKPIYHNFYWSYNVVLYIKKVMV